MKKGYITTAFAFVCLAECQASAMDFLTIEESQKIAFPNAKEFVVSHVLFNDQQKIEIEKLSGIPVQSKAQKIWKVIGEGNQHLGWFVVDYVIGKHLLIDYSVAINSDRKVTNVEVLSYRESYGGEIKSRSWLDQFKNKSIDSDITLNQDITNISGATLSSRHVTEGVKRVLATINVTQ